MKLLLRVGGPAVLFVLAAWIGSPLLWAAAIASFAVSIGLAIAEGRRVRPPYFPAEDLPRRHAG